MLKFAKQHPRLPWINLGHARRQNPCGEVRVHEDGTTSAKSRCVARIVFRAIIIYLFAGQISLICAKKKPARKDESVVEAVYANPSGKRERVNAVALSFQPITLTEFFILL